MVGLHAELTGGVLVCTDALVGGTAAGPQQQGCTKLCAAHTCSMLKTVFNMLDTCPNSRGVLHCCNVLCCSTCAALLQHFMLLQGSSCPAPNAIAARYSPIVSGAYCAHLCSPWAPCYRPAVPCCSNELLLCSGRNSSTCDIYVCHGFRNIY